MGIEFVIEPLTDEVEAAHTAIWTALAPGLKDEHHLVPRIARQRATKGSPEAFVVFLDWPNAAPPPNSRLSCNFSLMRSLVDQLPDEAAVQWVQAMLKAALETMDAKFITQS